MNQLKVFLLDDDEDDIYLFQKSIEDMNHVSFEGCTIFKKLKQAMLTSIQKSERFILFLDLNMPHVSGDRVLEYMKKDKELCQIPVIIYTTSPSPFDIQDSYRLGASGYLVKPQKIRDLKIKISSIVACYQNYMELPLG